MAVPFTMTFPLPQYIPSLIFWQNVMNTFRGCWRFCSAEQEITRRPASAQQLRRAGLVRVRIRSAKSEH